MNDDPWVGRGEDDHWAERGELDRQEGERVSALKQVLRAENFDT